MGVSTQEPYSGFAITKVTVNGVDVTSELVDGRYTVTNPQKNTDVEVVTRNLSTCTITYADIENGNFLYWYENIEKKVGETLKVKVRANEGYVVEAVYCNGEEMKYNASLGVYETVVQGDSVITASIKKADSSSDSSGNTSTQLSNSSWFAMIFTRLWQNFLDFLFNSPELSKK